LQKCLQIITKATPWEWQPKLKEYAEEKGLFLFSAPFDATAVDFLEKMNVSLYKVSSFEVVHIPLLKKIGQTKKPVIMSTGLCSKEEIALAIQTLKQAGCPNIILLHCISSYSAKPEEMNLATIPELEKNFSVLSGLSSHVPGTEDAVIATQLGACVIEKHLIILRDEGGPDAAFSLEPQEFSALVEKVRLVEKENISIDKTNPTTKTMLGTPSYGPGEEEAKNIIFRPSIWVKEDVKAGEILSKENIIIRRPNNGLTPKHFKEVLGKKASKDLEKCTPLKMYCVEK